MSDNQPNQAKPDWKTMGVQGPEWRECSMFVLSKLKSIDETAEKILDNQSNLKTEVAVIKAKAAASGAFTSCLFLGAVELVKYLVSHK